MLTQSPDKQLAFADEIRDKFVSELPEGQAYINAFYNHSKELVKIFCMRPEILLMWDDLMNEFNTNEISTGKVSEGTMGKMKAILNEVYQCASHNLRTAIDKHKFELDYYPDTMAFMMFSFYFF